MYEFALHTRQITKSFQVGKQNKHDALRGVDMDVRAGACVVLQGASGSGKTTLLTILGCLAKPTAGEYICLGEKVSKWSEKFLTSFRRKHIGLVFQQFQLLSGFTVAENIALPLIPLGMNVRTLNEYIQRAAEYANIAHKLQERIDVLSGGEQQRVAIARAIVSKPKILLADEPTSNLDRENASQILTLFADLKRAGTTLLLTTHDTFVSQNAVVDSILQMQDGKILAY
jgi:putative ABC transport system ATP-binding protein